MLFLFGIIILILLILELNDLFLQQNSYIMNASVIPLISLWEEFSTQNEKADLKKFAHWILQKEKDEVSENNKPEKKSELDDSAKAMLLISRLHRFMQMRSKPIIK